MSYPPREEQYYAGFAHVRGVIQESIGMKVIAHVIQCHDHHDNTAQKVNGFYSLGVDHKNKDMK